MLIDGRSVPSGSTLQSDVVVVGSGPAGLTLAQELASHSIKVTLLEAGGKNHNRADNAALDGDGSGAPFPLVRSRRRGFGGTSGHWEPETGLRVRPLDAIDFDARPGRPNDSWPFRPDELAPHYERAHEIIGLRSGYTPDRWFTAGSPTPLAWDGGPQLAMFQFADHDCFVRRYEAIQGSRHIDLVFRAAVGEIVLGGDGSAVERMVVFGEHGRRWDVKAKVFVLACGGIDNARILLASPGRTGAGVGNEFDNVGRYFMDHLSVDTGVIVPRAPISAGVFGHHRNGSGHYQPMLWLGSDVIAREGLPNAAFWVEERPSRYTSDGVSAARSLRLAIHGRPRQDVGARLAGALKGSGDLVAYSAERLLPRLGRRVLGMRIMTEQLPNRDSRIKLSPRRDALGIPLVDVDWKITSADLDVISEHQAHLARLLDARGVASLASRFDRRQHRLPVMSNYHHLGTTRMHVDARSGVVDPEGRVHSTMNLYAVGGSMFPTGGYLNPTLTIVALALRTADVLRRQLAPARADQLRAVRNQDTLDGRTSMRSQSPIFQAPNRGACSNDR
jgi:choline dehydrogenase-like flavoprotein